MTTDKETVKKAKQSTKWSKNRKKNWRNKIDITDIEDELDRKRLQLRTTGLVEEKSDKELFVIEKKATDEHTSRLEYYKTKRLNVDKIITPDPRAVLPQSNRNAAKFRRAAENRAKRINLANKLRKKLVPQSEPLRKENVDIWVKSANDIKDEMFHKDEIVKHTESVTGIGRLKRPKNLLKKPEFQAVKGISVVEVAHPGSSYNPTLDDHQSLLSLEHEKEVDKIRKHEEVLQKLAVDPADLVTKKIRDAETREGLFDDGDDSDAEEGENEEEVNEGDDIETAAGKVKARRKTRQQRQKAVQIKIRKSERRQKWLEKLRERDVDYVKHILLQIKKKKEQSEIRKAKEKVVNRPRLSAIKYQEADQDFNLSSDIHGCLRKVKPEGNLMFDRYKSLQKRCVIEPRVLVRHKRRYKLKCQEKKSFRDITL